MKSMDIIITKRDGAWTFGKVGGYSFEVKHLKNPSSFGIEQGGEPGRISKLWLGSDLSLRTVARYDRGWDLLPRSEEEIDATQAIIDRFN